jgi:hypothetical protein
MAYNTNIPYGFKTASSCEHCGDLEAGSLGISDEGIRWCIDCWGAEGKITAEQIKELHHLELHSLLSYARRVEQLEQAINET